MPPYKDPEKQKQRVKEAKSRWLGTATINFLPSEQRLYSAYKQTPGTSYIKTALIEKLKKDGYLNDNDEAP